MGLISNDDDEEQSNDNSGDSGTYIQFISGPGHRDWKESWSAEAAETISEAYHLAAPEADSVIPDFVTPAWEDRNHFYAEVTVALGDAFQDHDFTTMLDLLMGTDEDEPEEVVDMYAENIVEYLRENPEVGEKVMEKANSAEAAPADD